jgi:hypothetical protein
MKTIPHLLSSSKGGRVLYTISFIVFPALFSFIFAALAAIFLAFTMSPYLGGVALVLWFIGNAFNCYRLWAKRTEFIPISYLMNDGYLYLLEKSAKNGGRETVICDLTQVTPFIKSYETSVGGGSLESSSFGRDVEKFYIALHTPNNELRTGYESFECKNLQRNFDEIVHEIELAKKFTANPNSTLKNH